MPTHRRVSRDPWLVALLLVLLPIAAGAQARLVADLHTQPAAFSSLPRDFTAVGDRVFFSAISATAGRELWVTDGSPAGAHLVRDIQPGSASSDPASLVAFGDQVYFTANVGDGVQIWKSDGTAQGTVLAIRMKPGEFLSPGSSPPQLVVFDGALYFATYNIYKVYRSDGTQAGTQQLFNTSSQGTLFSSGDRLWAFVGNGFIVGDGTTAGMTGVTVSGVFLRERPIVAVGSQVYFVTRATGGLESIRRTDGTASGTRTITGLSVLPFIRSLVPFGTQLLAQVEELTTSRTSLYLVRSNATAQLLASLTGNGSFDDGSEVAVLGSSAYFARNVDGDRELWTTDGTTTGTLRVADIHAAGSSNPDDFRVAGGQLLFAAEDSTSGDRELWKSDGTAAGTQRVLDVAPGPGGSNPDLHAVIGDRLYFGADDGSSGVEPWTSDGTPLGTQRLANVWSDVGNAFLSELTELNGAAFFQAYGDDPNGDPSLWRSNGTPEGTLEVLQLHSSVTNASAHYLTPLAGRLYFSSVHNSNTGRPWESDGTPAGTRLVANMGVNGRMSEAGGAVLFIGGTPQSLWRVGANPTSNLALHAFTTLNVYARPMRAVGGVTLFAADDGSGVGEELWKTDGTPEGTALVKDMNPGSPHGGIGDSAVLGGRYYFAAYRPDVGNELWQSDGTPNGTTLFLDLEPGQISSSPRDLVAAGDRLYFAASRFGRSQLYASDGTSGATLLLDRLDPLYQSAYLGPARPSQVAVGERLFFAHDDGVHGTELWVSNGKPGGTLLVHDITPGPSPSQPSWMRAVGDRVVFYACTPDEGCEPWVSDGTQAGTHRIEDIEPGPTSASPSQFTPVGDALLFTAWRSDVGGELFAFDLGSCGDGGVGPLEECDDANAVPGDGCSASCNVDASWTLQGVAAGGSLSIEIDGVTLTLTTIAGQGVQEILGALANLIRDHPVLGARGVQAIAGPGRLITDGAIASPQVDDPGLVGGGPEVPALGALGAALLGALLLAVGRGRIRQR